MINLRQIVEIYILCVFLTLFFIFGTPFESALLDLSVSYNGICCESSTRETLEMDALGEKVCIYSAASAVCSVEVKKTLSKQPDTFAFLVAKNLRKS